mmetsp:Transcript_75811/g.214813  ORF Transcript_75811/g.214813 Transcript_75811/m.214813 type:complete len:229 (-) Transcript_75811:351-1037(-)
MRMLGVNGMRSLLTRVRTLLSSMTVFMDSIQVASMSPSSTSHLWTCEGLYPLISLLMLRMITAMAPSFHSFVFDIVPYSSSDVMAFGLTCSHTPSCPTAWQAFISDIQHSVLPQPVGPMMKQQCRTCRMSSSPCTFWTKPGSACSLRFRMMSAQTFSNLRSWNGSGLMPGNRSWIRRRKIGMSCVVIFGTLKSRRARQSTTFSSASGSWRFREPAWRSSDFTARRPQS